MGLRWEYGNRGVRIETRAEVFIFGRSLGGAVAVHIADLLKGDKHGDVRDGSGRQSIYNALSTD